MVVGLGSVTIPDEHCSQSSESWSKGRQSLGTETWRQVTHLTDTSCRISRSFDGKAFSSSCRNRRGLPLLVMRGCGTSWRRYEIKVMYLALIISSHLQHPDRLSAASISASTKPRPTQVVTPPPRWAEVGSEVMRTFIGHPLARTQSWAGLLEVSGNQDAAIFAGLRVYAKDLAAHLYKAAREKSVRQYTCGPSNHSHPSGRTLGSSTASWPATLQPRGYVSPCNASYGSLVPG